MSTALVELSLLQLGCNASKCVAKALSTYERFSGNSTVRKVARLGLRAQILFAFFFLASGFPAPPAAADQEDALNFVVGGTANYDSNIFRRPDSAGPQSDVFKSDYVGLRVDKPYAQQRFQFDVTETATRYNRFSNLNFDSLAYRSAWLWHLTPRISGTLGADRTESLIPFADTLGTARNLRSTKNRQFTVDGLVSGGWHLILGISQLEQKSEQPSLTTPDFRSVNGEAGVKYYASSGSSVSVLRRTAQGDYRNSTLLIPASPVVNDSYRQDESEIQANWNLSGRSTLDARLTWLDRQNAHLTQRNFSGLTGRLGYIWVPASKLTLDFAVQRDILPWQDIGTTYRVDNTISFAPTWQVSTRIALQARLDHIQSYFPGGSIGLNGSSRSDTTNSVLMGVNWLPVRSLTLAASLQGQRRFSNDSASEYRATTATVRASLLF